MIAVFATYRMLLRQQGTTGRLVLVGGFSALALVVAIAIGREDSRFRVDDSGSFMAGEGLGVRVPRGARVLGGEPRGGRWAKGAG